MSYRENEDREVNGLVVGAQGGGGSMEAKELALQAL